MIAIFHISKDYRVNKDTVYPGPLITEVEIGKMPRMRRAPGSGYVQRTAVFLLDTFFFFLPLSHIEISENGPNIIMTNVFIFIIVKTYNLR